MQKRRHAVVISSIEAKPRVAARHCLAKRWEGYQRENGDMRLWLAPSRRKPHVAAGHDLPNGGRAAHAKTETCGCD